MALTKKEYELALSKEYGFPVFLTDDEHKRLSASKPAPKGPKGEYQDPFAYMGKKPKNGPEDPWSSSAPGGAVKGKMYGGSAPTKKSSGVAKHIQGNPAADPWAAQPESEYVAIPVPAAPPVAPGNGKIGKIDTSGPELANPAMTYVAPPTAYGKPSTAPFAPPAQYEFDAYDFGIPDTGDPLTAKAPVGTVYPSVSGNAALDPWATDEQKYAAAFVGKK